ncbi:MAG: hypothetical protein VX899_12755 [Myxococcota bacterium]|nr:hypothetical protein [Myxococcota bacterium]
MPLNYDLLRLSAQRALLYNVPRSLRNLSMAVEDDALLLRAYMTHDPSGDEKDLLYEVSSEIAGDFVELLDSKSRTQFVVDNGPIDGLPTLRWVVFSLAE